MTAAEHRHTDADGGSLTVRPETEADIVYVTVVTRGGSGGTVDVTPDQASSVARAVLAKRSDVAVVEGLPEVGTVERRGGAILVDGIHYPDSISDDELLRYAARSLAVLAHRKAGREAREEDPAVEAVVVALIGPMGLLGDRRPLAERIVTLVDEARTPPADLAPIPQRGDVLDVTHAEPPVGSTVQINGYWWRHHAGKVMSWWTDGSSTAGWKSLHSMGTVTLVRWGAEA